MNSIRFQRANFMVRDIERALAFYRDVLGFEVAFTQGHNPASYSFPVFEIPPHAVLGFCVLSAPNQPRVMALTEVTNVPLDPIRPRRSAIVLEATDPDAVVAGAHKLGLQVYAEEVLSTADGRTGREIGIVDYDDNLVVIYSITPSQE
ncbi:VOC family protein [Rhodanobacter sp. AS-Z3]|uniref:VOC family protein n=1 Tax=Rhodanobacter sp. AS-Z3 TaxID=3031330 RepID=UPI00247A1AAD|nr:VOC family protein [Rhodanobacter sp. AS-Z3]WEN14099.1 VOC family protein [Rhodanobacter sp. AS-Z3]